MGEVRFRPMRPEDVPTAERVSDTSFLELDHRHRRHDEPVPSGRDEVGRELWCERTRHLLRTDPAGCWVATEGSEVVGIATSLRRETLWALATYAVLPARQGQGIGWPLLTAALHHGRGCTRALVSASTDARAVRLYHRAGLALHPQLALVGSVDRAAIPVVEKVRDGSAADVDLMDSLDRRTRGAGHGPDHEHMIRVWQLLVSDSTTGSGYAYLDHRGRLALLAADNRRTATRLLWAVLADGAADTTVNHVTGANQWAIDVGLAARLELRPSGYLALRGLDPPAPYVHNGALL